MCKACEAGNPRVHRGYRAPGIGFDEDLVQLIWMPHTAPQVYFGRGSVVGVRRALTTKHAFRIQLLVRPE
jgi:hypothetical protein